VLVHSTVLYSIWKRLIRLRYILLSIYLPISPIWCVQCSIQNNRQRDLVERHGQYRGDLITHWKASFRQQVLSGCVVKGLLGGLTVLLEVEALMFCSTGKLQDKDPHCLIPARLQNKRESCCFIKTTRHSVCPCLYVNVWMCEYCGFFFFFFQLCSYCAKKMIYSIFDEVAAKLLKPLLECFVRNSTFLLSCFLSLISEHVNHPQSRENWSARTAFAHCEVTFYSWWWIWSNYTLVLFTLSRWI